MPGITNLKLVISFALKAIETSLNIDKNKDGKLSFGEITSAIAGLAWSSPDVIEAWPDVGKEFQDLDQEELDELTDHIKAEFDLPDDKEILEKIIERILDGLNDLYDTSSDVVQLIKQAKAS